ncbi:MAG: restriction endonuclease, partial [Chloroflexota bacterium]
GIDKGFLRRFKEFKEFQKAVAPQQKTAQTPDIAVQTPTEILERTYQNLREELAVDLLERIRKSPPRFFEQLVVDLLIAMGYGGSPADVLQAMGRTGDEGIDGIIKEDKLQTSGHDSCQ